MVIFMIFAPPHHLNRVKEYSQLLLCEARKCSAHGIQDRSRVNTLVFLVSLDAGLLGGSKLGVNRRLRCLSVAIYSYWKEER